MSARAPSALKRSLLSCAIALAAGGFAQGAMADGIVIGLGGGITNSGTINASAQDNGTGIGAGGSPGNTGPFAGTFIMGTDSLLNFVPANSPPALLNGQLLYPSPDNAFATLSNVGNMAVVTDGASNYPALLLNGDLLGTVENRSPGTISAIGNGTVAASAIAFSIAGNVAGSVSNSGSITAGAISTRSSAVAHALSVTGNISGSVSNSGTISATAISPKSTASAYALSVTGNISGSVSNNGTISAAAISTLSSAFATALSVTGTLTGSLSNNGLIKVFAHTSGGYYSADAYGIYVHALEVATPPPGLTTAAAPLLLNTGNIIAIADSGADTGYANAYGIDVGTLGAGTKVQSTGLIYARGNDNGETYGIYVGSGSGEVLNSGAIYGGVSLGGTVSLFNSGGILTRSGQSSHVSGNYTQTSDGLLDFGLRDSAHYGRVTIAGTADFAGGNWLEAEIDAAHTLADGDQFNDVITAGTLIATSFHVIDNSVFWNFTAAIDGNTVDLTAHKVAAAEALAGSGFALSPSLAALVDGVISEGNAGPYAVLANALDAAGTASAAAAILKQLEPVIGGGAAQATRASGAGAARALDAHIAETRGAASGDAVAESAVWIKPFVGKATQDAANGISGYDVDSSGFMIGVDTAVTDAWQLGLAYAGSKSNVDGSAGSTLDISTTQFVVYGAYAIDNRTALDLNIGMAGNAYDNHRAAFGNGVALANYHGTQLSAGAELSRQYKLNNRIAFIPSLALRVDQIRIDAYNETGATINLSVQGTEENSVQLAAKGRFEWSLGHAGVLLANLGVSSFSSDAASVTASLSGNGPTFVNNGISPDSWVMNSGLGYRYVTKESLAITAAYDLEKSSGFQASTLSLKFNMPF